MCRVCGFEMTMAASGVKSQGMQYCLNVDSSVLMDAKFCDEKKEQDSMRLGILSPTPSNIPAISPTVVFCGSDSPTSIYSDFLVDLDLYDRYYRGNQEDVVPTSNGQLLVSIVEAATINGHCGPPNKVIEEKDEEFYCRICVDITRDTETMPGSDLSVMDGSGHRGNSYAFGDEMEDWIWEPPEPENPVNDVTGSVIGDHHDEDDVECVHDMQLGQPGFSDALGGLDRRNYNYREEKRKAMNEVLNGKFKALVRQLLECSGVPSSEDGDESWVDIVTSLSWEAASFSKPDMVDGKAIDPDLLVKIKYVATGSRSQSQFVKGLVFKKHAAHKHMPTMYNNPKLLLIKGMLGQSPSSLSSFNSMEEEKDGLLKRVVDMIEMSNPSVVFVEKFVSRDVQEYILAKGITLVFDTKLHRLERIALCTCSQIVSMDKLNIQKLNSCDSFRIVKFVEELAVPGEGGKRPSKTLMFLEGCPTRLGCTILLKGSSSDELKKIKSVMQSSVPLAYHLILETSFLVDQRAMFFTIPSSVINNTWSDQPTQTSDDTDTGDSSSGRPPLKERMAVDIPRSHGFSCGNDQTESDGSSPISNEPYNLETEESLKANVQITKKPDGEIEVNLDNSGPCDEQTESVMASSEVCLKSREDGGPVSTPSKCSDSMRCLLDNKSILVLMSCHNALRGLICVQSHFSRITFYKDFDLPIGKFLRENVLNQFSQCTACASPPEAHRYYYAHHGEQLTIQVKRLPMSKRLTGEQEVKLWMWSCCSQCKPESRAKASTKRILLSSTARRLSFGKFLELGFAHHSSVSSTRICGHSLRRDYLYFFGFGPVVAIFKYSPVTMYTVSMPPRRLEFHCTVRSYWLKEETGRVYMKGKQLFSEIKSSLEKVVANMSSSFPLDQGTSQELLLQIEKMLKEEKREFELKMENLLETEYPHEDYYKLLNLNRIQWELYIESVIWDRRLHSLSRNPAYVPNFSSENPILDTSESESVICGSSSGNENAEQERNSMKESSCRRITEEVADSDQNASIEGSLSKNKVPDGKFNTNIMTQSEINLKPEKLEDDKSSLPDHLRVRTTAPSLSNLSISDTNSSGCEGLSVSGLMQPNSQHIHAWIWKSFSEIQEIYVSELRRGCSRNYEPSSGQTAEMLPTGLQLISEEGSRLHILLNNDAYMVSDFEGELSSIIASALALLKDQPAIEESNNDDSRLDTGVAIRAAESLHNSIRLPSMPSIRSSSNSSFDSDVPNSPNSVFSEESQSSSFDRLAVLDSLNPSATSKAEVSLGVTKSQGKGKYSVVCLYANEFRDLRNMCCPSEDDFIASLSRCRDWDAKGGKSKSFFSKTLDGRLIIKEIKKTEFDSFEKFAPHYFKHIKESYESGNQTCLAKVLGIYQVTIRQLKPGKEVRRDLMVMENLSFGQKITRQYDLKGALHARFTSITDGTGDVLLDQNFVNDMKFSPLYVGNKAKNVLQRAVWNDTRFLELINVMDYSLLVGVDGQKQELVCGIIDYLRQYTWDKQLETWVKSSLYVPKKVLPTVISPKEYKKRFRKFISENFPCIPDDWCKVFSSDCDSTQQPTTEGQNVGSNPSPTRPEKAT
ncbi:hypothetical protein MLD38_001623 [Melastoma candidum]|uniref:Uncharacterized protein n=1 Tax=Melastoma candidum TaxID=119954 RepID=A0ACB9SFF8_9MYRT|nr:hypothetical protein MLD38_001623 [Melastoma candidum]